MPYFTVFTPTYNRAYILSQVYESLRVQTFQDFEWLIIDDGSTDGTQALVEEWIKKKELNIRYIYQNNQGKHAAHNVAVEHATGYLFLVFDSDDRCVNTALERLKFHWEDIDISQRDQFSTLSVLCMDDESNVLGQEYPNYICDIADPDLQRQYRSMGDKWGVNVTEILKQYEFPIIAGERFIAESIVWNRVSLFYSARFVNEKLCIKIYRNDGLTQSSVRIRVNNPCGASLVYLEEFKILKGIASRFKSAINYVRFALRTNKMEIIFPSCKASLLMMCAFPVGCAFYFVDSYRVKK
ncbi:hypothetical protein PS887_01748 [Pseudomonas fluorescens]|nr:hypothetical protein PS887_01748 [Pseudomonas fluorescens]